MPRLRRSQPAGPGYSRIPADGPTAVDAPTNGHAAGDSGFSYLDPHGSPVTDPDLIARFDALVLPPAWTEVWLCPYANGHIQATGVDAAGRRQYHYHPAWRIRMDAIKFDRALHLAEVLPTARRRVRRNLQEQGFPRERALAVAFRLLDEASLRVGSEVYAREHGSFGLASLTCQHASVSGEIVHLDFPAKSHHHWQSDVTDADLATFVADRQASAAELDPAVAAAVVRHVEESVTAEHSARSHPEIADQQFRLLAFQDSGSWHRLTPQDINEEVRAQTGGHFSAKDFRTLHGTIAAAQHLANAGHVPSEAKRNRIVAAAMRSAAATLNNTPAVAKASYVDPRVVDHYHHGRTIDPSASPEPELLRLIGHQREPSEPGAAAAPRAPAHQGD